CEVIFLLGAAAFARGMERQTARHDAGADRQAGPDDERGSGQVRADARRGARCQGCRLSWRNDYPIFNLTNQEDEMAVQQVEILDKIASVTRLELSELIKAMEEKCGVSAAAAVAAAAPAAA